MSRWLNIVGIGGDGSASLAPAARAAIAHAQWVFGSNRQLALVQEYVRGTAVPWPSPLERGLKMLSDRRGQACCVLASGDPFHYGIGATLARHFAPAEYRSLPGPSSISLAAAALGWPLQDVTVVSLHGRPLDTLREHLEQGARLLVLSWDGTTPYRVAKHLSQAGFGDSRVWVLEQLGTARQRVTDHAPDGVPKRVDDLNLIALDLSPTAAAPALSPCALADDRYDHDGQITKQDLRALTLTALQPWGGGRLWDVGAGSGSVSIEWIRTRGHNEALAFERDPQRCTRMARNAAALGAQRLQVVQGTVPDSLAARPLPDAIFVGGGASTSVLDTCWHALRPAGRMVFNAVTLGSQQLATEAFNERGGQLKRITVERALPLGRHTAWRPALPLVQWTGIKP